MRRLVDLVKLARLDDLIRRKATGSPVELAERLDLSRSSLFEIIAFLKDEMRAPIIYDRNRPSYIYSYTPKFYLGFEQDDTRSIKINDTFDSDPAEQNHKIDHQYFLMDDDIDFNNLYQ